MFEQVQENWKKYASLMAAQISEDDLRYNRATEVRIRLNQLDRILVNIDNALRVIRGNPGDIEGVHAWAVANYAAFERGDISWDEWTAGTLPSRTSEPEDLVLAYDDALMFTESFYFFAWRLVEALNAKSPDRFPRLDKIRANGVTIVRNHLLQHPECHGWNFLQGMVITDAGPVLRSTAMVVMNTGEMHPVDESKGKGLFTAARELHDELEAKIDKAINGLTEA